MTQEDKQLLLKDLCARLPYKCKCKASKGITHWHKLTLNPETIDKIIDDYYDEIKPYLRPMSSMTEEEWKEFSVFIGKTEMYIQQIRMDADSMSNPIIGGFKCVYWGLFDKCIDWLLAHHFDFRGLIEKGLALEALEDMYKEK